MIRHVFLFLGSASCLMLNNSGLEKSKFVEFTQRSTSTQKHSGCSDDGRDCAKHEHEDARELLRYITPYNTNMDVMYDVSGHAPLLMGNNEKNPLKFYSFIDTWSSGVPRAWLWEDGAKQNCQAVNPISGDNGFLVRAELHYWEKENTGKVTKVVSAQTPGPFGHPLILGEPQVMTATLKRNVTQPQTAVRASLLETKKIDDHELTSQKATVYRCKDTSDLQQAMRHANTFNSDFASFLEMDTMDSNDLSEGREVKAESENTIRVDLQEKDLALWKVGAKVYVPKHTASSSDWSSGASEVNEAVGVVKAIDTSKSLIQDGEPTHSAQVEITSGCPCLQNTERAWVASVPKDNSHVSDLVELGEAVPEKGDLYRFTPAKAKTTTDSGQASFIQENAVEEVCMVRNPSPRLLETEVDLGTALADNERVFAHFVGTGHGWEHTNRQCGEFCPVKYSLSLHGKSNEEFKLWRTDCGSNPNGGEQQGTWSTSRNGWCPGAMSAGWWGDVTDHVKEGGKVPVALDVHVEGSDNYINQDGFNFNDKAMIQSSLTFHRYTSAPDTGTGSSVARATTAEETASFDEEDSTMVRSSVTREREDSKTSTRVPFDHTAGDTPTARGNSAPWYPVNKDALESDAATYVVPVFTGDIHQLHTRTIYSTADTSHIDPTKTYQIGLRFRLEAPPSPFIEDKWDRYASIGVFESKHEA